MAYRRPWVQFAVGAREEGREGGKNGGGEREGEEEGEIKKEGRQAGSLDWVCISLAVFVQ